MTQDKQPYPNNILPSTDRELAFSGAGLLLGTLITTSVIGLGIRTATNKNVNAPVSPKMVEMYAAVSATHTSGRLEPGVVESASKYFNPAIQENNGQLSCNSENPDTEKTTMVTGRSRYDPGLREHVSTVVIQDNRDLYKGPTTLEMDLANPGGHPVTVGRIIDHSNGLDETFSHRRGFAGVQIDNENNQTQFSEVYIADLLERSMAACNF